VIYAALGKYIEEFRKQEAEQSTAGRLGAGRLKETEIFYFLVFLLRVGRQQTNGRPRARMFLEFLRSQLPRTAAPEQNEASRIILP